MSPPENLIFDGKPGENVTLFLQKVKRVAFAEGQRDNYWLADYVETCLIDDALVWYDALDEIIQRDFRLLRTAMLQHFISNVPLPAPAASSPPLQMKRWGRIRVVRHDGLAPEYCGQEQDQKWCMRCGRTSTESESLIVELCREPDPLKTKSRSLLRVVSPNGPTSNKFLGVSLNWRSSDCDLESWGLCICDAGVSFPYPRSRSFSNSQMEAASMIWSLDNDSHELFVTWVGSDGDSFKLKVIANTGSDIWLRSSRDIGSDPSYNAKLYFEPLR